MLFGCLEKKINIKNKEKYICLFLLIDILFLNQTTKQLDNKTTRQQNNQTTKQPDNTNVFLFIDIFPKRPAKMSHLT